MASCAALPEMVHYISGNAISSDCMMGYSTELIHRGIFAVNFTWVLIIVLGSPGIRGLVAM